MTRNLVTCTGQYDESPAAGSQHTHKRRVPFGRHVSPSSSVLVSPTILTIRSYIRHLVIIVLTLLEKILIILLKSSNWRLTTVQSIFHKIVLSVL